MSKKSVEHRRLEAKRNVEQYREGADPTKYQEISMVVRSFEDEERRRSIESNGWQKRDDCPFDFCLTALASPRDHF